MGIGELMINRRLDDPLLREIFAAAGELGLPVTFHMSPRVGFGYGVVDDPGLPLLEKTLQDFPDTIFLGHSQPFWIEMSGDAPTDAEGRNAWGQGPVVPGGRVPALFEKYPNLYGDLSANSAGCALMRDPEFGTVRPTAIFCHRHGQHRDGVPAGSMAGPPGCRRPPEPRRL